MFLLSFCLLSGLFLEWDMVELLRWSGGAGGQWLRARGGRERARILNPPLGSMKYFYIPVKYGKINVLSVKI